MVVARIHGKVNCKRFKKKKEKRRRALLTEHGITSSSLCCIFSSYAHFIYLFSSQGCGIQSGIKRERRPDKDFAFFFLCSCSFHLEIGYNVWQKSEA